MLSPRMMMILGLLVAAPDGAPGGAQYALVRPAASAAASSAHVTSPGNFIASDYSTGGGGRFPAAEELLSALDQRHQLPGPLVARLERQHLLAFGERTFVVTHVMQRTRKVQ